MAEDLITLAEARSRFGLDAATVQRVRYRLGIAKAVAHHGPRGAYFYHVGDVAAAIRLVRSYRRKPAPVVPADDLAHCRCGRTWIDQPSLERHIARDHGGIEPDGPPPPPPAPERDRDQVIADVRAELGRTERLWRQYPERGGAES